MKALVYIVGVVMILSGLALGLYVGIWVMLIGGIVAIVEACKVNPVDSMGVALGVVRVILCTFTGWLSAIALIFPGMALIGAANTANASGRIRNYGRRIR